MRTQREVQPVPCNNYYISAAPQILFICMAAALSAVGGLLVMLVAAEGDYVTYAQLQFGCTVHIHNVHIRDVHILYCPKLYNS